MVVYWFGFMFQIMWRNVEYEEIFVTTFEPFGEDRQIISL